MECGARPGGRTEASGPTDDKEICASSVRADVGIGPYGWGYKECNGRATARVAPTEGYKRCGGVKNPPVTASPRQSPLGKGTEGTGETDCHSRCAHRPRNDTFSRSAVQARAGGVEPRPYGGVTRSAMGGRPQGSPLRKRCKGAEGTGGTDCHSQFANWLRNDNFSRSAVGFFAVRRGGALPLPRATARVAPTEGYKRVRYGGPMGAAFSTGSF